MRLISLSVRRVCFSLALSALSWPVESFSNDSQKSTLHDAYSVGLKLKLAKMNAIKEPFYKLAGWAPTAAFGLIGLAITIYAYLHGDVYRDMHDEYLGAMILANNAQEKVLAKQCFDYAGLVLNHYNRMWNLGMVCCSIPWGAALVNKWFDLSCQYYEKAIATTEKENDNY